MKKLLLLLTLSTVLLFTLNSCEEENLITGASGNTGTSTNNPSTGTNTGTTTTKCYVKEIIEMEDGKTYKNKLTYNTKNLLTTLDQDGASSTYEYDANNRVTKLTQVDGQGVETYTYTYDSKGNMTNIKYAAKNTSFQILVTEYKLTTNSSGQVTQVTAVTKEDGDISFLFEYDKNNVKKVLVSDGNVKETLLENLTFDSKIGTYTNTALAKANIPFVVLGVFFGENLTYYMNANNILTDKVIGVFTGEPVTTTFKYEYTKDNLPTKMTYLQIDGLDKYEGSSTFTYDCK